MEIYEALKNDNIELLEQILLNKVKEEPDNMDNWIKLCLTELLYPFEDYVTALTYINKIKKRNNNIKLLFLEASIKWHNYGEIDKELFKRLKDFETDNEKEKAIIYYFMSLFYMNSNLIKRKELLLKSIELCKTNVYQYKELASVLKREGKYDDAWKMINKAIDNVIKIYEEGEGYEYLNYDLYVGEYITGTHISKGNYELIKKIKTEIEEMINE